MCAVCVATGALVVVVVFFMDGSMQQSENGASIIFVLCEFTYEKKIREKQNEHLPALRICESVER